MKVIVTGATGMLGSEVIRQCISDPEIAEVTAITRKAPDIQHEKLKVVLHENFSNFDAISTKLEGQDACLWCLGISQTQVDTDKEYHEITHNYAMLAARAMLAASPDMAFGFVSGQGADPSMKSSILFARVKGKTENTLADMSFKKLYIFRPGHIHPSQPRSKPGLEDRVISPLYPVLYRWIPGFINNSIEVSKAMIQVMKHGYEKKVLENRDLRNISASL